MRISVLDELAKRGSIFTVQDVLRTMNVSRNMLWVILSRLEKKGWIERIEKGKYMIIPLGAEKGKYTLNEFVIGSILVSPYSIAYWSALNFYGLTEQIPNTVFMQSTTRKKKQTCEIFGVSYSIIRVKNEKFFGIQKQWIEGTPINITNREKTIVDCLDKPQCCGGIIEVAKALKEGEFNVERLIGYAWRIRNSGVMRRLGYLCERLSLDINVPRIKTRSYLYLDPAMPHRGSTISKWRLIINLNDKILENLE